MNEINGEGNPPEEGSMEEVASAAEASVAPSELPEKAKRSLANPEVQKMMIYLIVMINAALLVVGSLLPWLSGNNICLLYTSPSPRD